jgi:hypothetical protein
MASGLLLRSFEKMRQVDTGFRVDHTLSAFYGLPQKRYATQSAIDNVACRSDLSAFFKAAAPLIQQINGNYRVGEVYMRPTDYSTSK